MLILWTDKGQERAARFTIEAEALNFIELLRLRHGVQQDEIQLLDEDGVPLEASWAGDSGI